MGSWDMSKQPVWGEKEDETMPADFERDDEERQHRNDPPAHGAFMVTTEEIGDALKKIEGKD
jgi:hypothetical protein